MSARRHFHAVILAGGRGTRFWPSSRADLPKQLLPVVGESSLLQQTAARLERLAPPERLWVLTSDRLRGRVRQQLPQVPPRQIIAEPVQRNSGPAIALAARVLAEQDPDAVMGVFPADHFIARPAVFATVIKRGIKAATEDELIVLGIPPRHPETGYGYIKFPKGVKVGDPRPSRVVKFEEKPPQAKARRFVRAGNYSWNSGMFVWQARAITKAVAEYLPRTAAALAKVAPLSSRKFASSLRKQYPLCDNRSIDYGVLEHAKNIVAFACSEFGWNDVGSWQAVYELGHADRAGNVTSGDVLQLDARGNYVDARAKPVALVGVRDLVVVDTPDALLVCSRDAAQDVSSLVKRLEKMGRDDLL